MSSRTLNIFLDAVPSGLDGLSTESFAQWTVVYNLADRLLEFGPHGELVGNLATSWKQLGPNHKAWKFTLDSGRKFHDGTDITIDSVVSSLRRSASSKQLYGSESNFFDPNGIYAESDNSLIITATKADVSVLEQLNMNSFAIRKECSSGPVYSGPYRIKEHSIHRIWLTAVTDHPAILLDSYKDIVIKKIEGESAGNFGLLDSGDCVLLSRHGLALERIGLPSHARMFPFASGNSHVLCLRTSTPNLEWIKFSIHEIIYKRSILSSISHARPLNSFFPPGYVVHAPEIPNICSKPEKLTELSVSVPLEIANTLALDALSRELMTFNISVEWVKTDKWTKLDDRGEDNRDGFIAACYLDNQDPVRLASHYFSGTRSIVQHLPSFIEGMLDKAKNTSPGLDRDRMIRNFYKAVVRETPCIPLYFCPMVAWSSGDVNISDLEYYGNTFKFPKIRIGVALNQNSADIAMSLRMFAHDFKRPFSLIKTAGRLIENATSIEDIRKISESLLPQMNQAMTSVDGMIKGLLNTQDKPSNELDHCDLFAAIKNSIDQSLATYGQTERSIEFLKGPDQIIAYGDSIDIERIFANLIHNALEAAPPMARIWVKVDIPTSYSEVNEIEVRVGNSGSFIEPVLKEKLFVNGFSQKGAGRGLGLSIVHSLVQKLNGAISVNSDEHDGTEFCVTLKIKSRLKKLAEKLSFKVKLILIEDDPFIREAWECIWKQNDIQTFANLEEVHTAIFAGALQLESNTVVVTDYFFEDSKFDGKDIIKFARSQNVKSILLASDFVDPEIESLVDATIGKTPLTPAEGNSLWGINGPLFRHKE
jgi:two-component sensor histidine kinase